MRDSSLGLCVTLVFQHFLFRTTSSFSWVSAAILTIIENGSEDGLVRCGGAVPALEAKLRLTLVDAAPHALAHTRDGVGRVLAQLHLVSGRHDML